MVELENYILRYCPLNNEDLTTVLSKFTTKTISRKHHLLKQGQVCREFVYVAKGLFRQYFKDIHDKEITSWISFENTPATELASFLSQQPAKFYIQALEDSEVAAISYADLQELYLILPAFQEFGRKLAEKILVGAINRTVSFQKETAAQRYNMLLQRPEYFQRVPLKYLASMIGITDTSLSRLRRKRMS
jgi:CRP/FNR family transcriptional regulator, anaerobic regulatory protein